MAEDIGDIKDIMEEQKLLLDTIDTQIWYLTDEETYGKVNQAFADFVGVEKHEIENKSIWDIREKDEAKKCVKGNKEVFQKKEKIKKGEWVKNSVGQKRYLSITKKPKLNEQGEAEYVVCSAKDITERKEKEKQLQERVKELGFLYDISKIMVEEERGREEIFQEVAEKLPQAMQHPDYTSARIIINDQEFISANFKTGSNKFSTELKLSEGDSGFIEVYSSAEVQKTGGFYLQEEKYLLESLSAQLGSLIQLRETQENLQKMKFSVDNAAIGVYLLTPEGRFEYVNNMACEMLNYSQEELTGKKVSDIDINTSEREEAWKKLKKHKFEKLESHHETREGKVIPVQITRRYLEYREKEYEFTFVQDITKRKKKAEELKTQNYRMEKLHEAAFELAEINTKKEVCQKTVEAAGKVLELNFCNISLARDGKLRPQASRGAEALIREVTEESIAARTYREKESYLIENIHEHTETGPVDNHYKSGISIPVGDFGVFQAISKQGKTFTEKDLKLAELLISHTGAALKRIHFQEELKYKSFHDELTGLYNRRFFEEEKNRLDTKRQLPISLIMVDVNGLKIINDSLGHKKGDELLRKTAEILQNALREEDIIARYGGDEFVILLPKTSSKMAQKISERILQDCEKTAEDELPVSLGVGIATKYDTSENIADVLTKADNNMLQNKLITSRSTKNKIIESLLNVLGSKCDETKEHTRRMTELAHDLGEKVGLSPSELDKLSLLASLHDIGKASISEKILTKPGDLNDEEWEIMKNHPQRGYKIALASEEFAVVAEEILSHHERWDGDGYPRGLKGEEIPYLARILTIVDAYDVMISGRPYQQAVSKEEALAEINKCAGKQFDPELAEEFVGMMREGKNRG